MTTQTFITMKTGVWIPIPFWLLLCSFIVPTEGFLGHSVGLPLRSLKVAVATTSDVEKEEVIADFVSRVQDAINSETFVSLTVHGASNKKKKATDVAAAAAFRGSIRQVQGRVIHLKKEKLPLLQLTIKFHGATDICKNLELATLGRSLCNFLLEPPASEWGAEATQPFQGADLLTLDSMWTVRSMHQSPKIQRKDTTPSQAAVAVQPASHDRTKQVPLAHESNPSYLQALGLTKPDGSPRSGMSSKLRQCNKFVEIVSGLIGKASVGQRIRIVDMGCGRGYLTFALHSYLTQQHRYAVESTGIDVRPKLVAEISGIAQSLGGVFGSLCFKAGTIEDIVSRDETCMFGETVEGEKSSLDILIALHACDTATDDALWSGISQNADIIVVAPCCHKEIRSQLDVHVASTKKSHPMYDVLKFGVYRERISETVTDSLRALLLESAGYKVQVFEFIGGEHTSKNVMITAVKSSKSAPKDTNLRIKELAALHGIMQHRLASWMGTKLGDSDVSIPAKRASHLVRTQMPPKVT